MKAVAWLGSWVAAVIVAVLVRTRRLPVLALDVAVLMRAGETGGVQIGKTCPGPRAAPASHPPGSGSRLLVSFQPCRGGVPGVHGLGLVPGCARRPPGGVDSGLAGRPAGHRGDRVLLGGQKPSRTTTMGIASWS